MFHPRPLLIKGMSWDAVGISPALRARRAWHGFLKPVSLLKKGFGMVWMMVFYGFLL
jgi:hypothetical protein